MSIFLENKHYVLKINEGGYAESLLHKASGEEFIAIEYVENGENKCLTYNTITGKYTDSVVE